MSKRSKSSPAAPVKIQISTKSQPSSKPKARKSKARSSALRGSAPSWLNAVIDPFDHPPVAVPDEQTAPSVKYVSTFKGFITTNDAGNSNNHGLLLGISPIPCTSGAPAGAFTYAQRGYSSTVDAYTGVVSASLTTAGGLINGSAMFPAITSSTGGTQTGYLFRCTALEARVTYLGTELNRAGVVTMGLAEPLIPSSSLTGTTHSFNPINRVYGGLYTDTTTTSEVNHATVANRLRRSARYRTKDGSEVIRWIPTGVPEYSPLPLNNAQTMSLWQEAGPEIIIAITDDWTTTNGPLGNSWSVEVMHHYEVIPQSRTALCVPVTPSHYDPSALALCLNAFQMMQSSYTETDMGLSSAPDGHQNMPGSSWEAVGRVINSASDLLSNPGVQRIAVNAAMGYMRSQRQAQQRPLIRAG